MNRLKTTSISIRALWLCVPVLLSSCGEGSKKASTEKKETRPNIIFILADDLGYGELGVFGQEKIETRHIDALARQGMLFTQHYTGAPVCAPARYMFLTGKHAGNAYIRGNHEWAKRGEVRNYLAMAHDSTLEGQHPMPKETVTLAHKLQEVGYETALVGKWGLGAPHTHSLPNTMGFDYFFGYNCQRQAHTYYPLHLYENKNRVHLANDTIAPHTALSKNLDPLDTASYANFNLAQYAPDLLFQALTDFVAAPRDKPFFLYWATPLPHVPLQAPQRWVDHYVRKFGEETPYLGDTGGYFPHKNPRAGYAAMISYFDENVGKLVAQLKAQGQFENTLIVFTSDNGPSFTGGTDSAWFNSGGPFGEAYGQGKGFVYEGGIRVPTFFSWPAKIGKGTQSHLASAHYDMMATFGDIAGYRPPSDTNGISLLPTLLGREGQKEHPFMYWEFPAYGGQVALRMGPWKVVRQNVMDSEPATLELYHLETDPTESDNVAQEHPEVLERAAQIFERERTPPELQRFNMPLLDNGLLAKTP
ncbi:arylsulfatase [Maribacter sp. 2307ULW6-5]|uniref:arylsulfatase n=1 Tax=Maribacter sp. 2307ULW6-5 TaxID=3386275 RepID=UPI0039BCFE8D